MKVIVNDHTPLIVQDQAGNVLYEWIPEKKYINLTKKYFTRLSELIETEEYIKRNK